MIAFTRSLSVSLRAATALVREQPACDITIEISFSVGSTSSSSSKVFVCFSIGAGSSPPLFGIAIHLSFGASLLLDEMGIAA